MTWRDIIDIFLKLDVHLDRWAGELGAGLYVLLFAIVFCETGLVVTPFLPGDSLLFAVGALAARDGSPIDPFLAGALLIVAAVAGDAVTYAIGYRAGPKIYNRPSSWLLNQEHLRRAQRFYENYGGKTIILARFVPIVRTFAPFVAGIGRMSYPRFAAFNVAGAVIWVTSLLGLGYWFGNREFVKKHFEIVILAIIFISVLPMVVELVRAQLEAKRAAAKAPPAAPAPPPGDVPAPKDGGTV